MCISDDIYYFESVNNWEKTTPETQGLTKSREGPVQGDRLGGFFVTNTHSYYYESVHNWENTTPKTLWQLNLLRHHPLNFGLCTLLELAQSCISNFEYCDNYAPAALAIPFQIVASEKDGTYDFVIVVEGLQDVLWRQGFAQTFLLRLWHC